MSRLRQRATAGQQGSTVEADTRPIFPAAGVTGLPDEGNRHHIPAPRLGVGLDELLGNWIDGGTE